MLSNRWIRYLIIGSIVLLLISAILRLITPQPVPIPQTALVTQNVADIPAVLRNIRYTGSPITVPKSFSIAKLTSSDDTRAENLKNQLITEYHLTAQAGAPNVWVGGDFSLYYNDQFQQYSLMSNFPPDINSSFSGVLDKTQAIQVAQNFITKYLPANQHVQTNPSVLQFFTGETDLGPGTEQNATWVLVPFSYFIDGYPVLYKNTTALPFGVMLDNQYHVKRFNYFPFFINYSTFQKNNSISLNQAIDNINNQKAAILSIQNQQAGPTDLRQITTGEMTAVTLEYHYDDKIQLIYPFYHFSGRVTTTDGNQHQVDLITPAIETTPQL